MSVAALEAALGGIPPALVAWLGSPVVEASFLSPIRVPGYARSASRVRLADGRTVKVRRLPTVARAQEVEGILADVGDPAFARALFRHEQVLVEEWVEGVPLDAASAGLDDAREAGDLLGRLHAHRLGDRAPAAVARGRESAEMVRHVEDLARLGALAAADAARLAAAAVAGEPPDVEEGLCHGDLCPENLVRDGQGVLRVIDNEGLALGSLDGDLAVVERRWPMTSELRARFLGAYAARRDPAAALEHRRFWSLRALLKSAHVRLVRLRRDEPRLAAELRSFAGES